MKWPSRSGQVARPYNLATWPFGRLNFENLYQPTALMPERMRAFFMEDYILPMNENKVTATPKPAEPPVLVKKIGNTTYNVVVHFSETSKETLEDKVKRLIQNDCVNGTNN